MLTAILNGGLRALVLIPRLGESAGHVLSTLILCIAIGLITWLTISWIQPPTLGSAVAVGALWLVLTVTFEFGAGHYLFGQPWSRLLADYDVVRGRVWVLVLLTTAAAPPLAAHARSRHK